MDTFGSRVSLTLRSLALAAVAVLAVAGCTKKGKDITITAGGEKVTLAYNETLRMRMASEPPSLDWHKATDAESSKITVNLMDGLAEYSYANKEPEVVPALAEKWETKDNKTWTITIRQDVKWSDGQPLTAQHFVDAWRRLLEPVTAAEYAYFLFPVKNAQAFNSGKIKDFAQVGVKAPAANQLVVELERPVAFLPLLFAHHSTYPVRIDVVQKHGDKWTEPGNIVTLGAFTLKAWEHDKQVVLERNDNYYGKKAVLKYVVFLLIQEVTTAINLFDSDKLDSVDDLPAQEMRKLKTRPEFSQLGTLSVTYYGFNIEKKPFTDVKVRKAFAHAINRQEIVDVLAGGQTPMTSFVPIGMFGYEATRGIQFDVEKAKALLKEAGYADLTKFPQVELRFNTQENNQLVAENVQAQLRKNLGIDVSIRNEEWKVFLKTLQNDTPQLFRMGWVGDYPDPDNFLNLFTSYSENNHTKWKSKEYDSIIEKAASELDRAKRAELYSQAQKLLVEDDVPIVPLFSRVLHHLVKPRLVNYPVNVLERYRLNEVSFK